MVDRGEDGTAEFPLDEVASVCVSNQQVTFTLPSLSALAEAEIPLIICDSKHMPVGLMLPIAGGSSQTEVMAAQAAMSEPMKKSLWRQLVAAKIAGQAKVLSQLHGNDFGLLETAARVKPGDPDNVEAWAARIYWHALFGDEKFIRDRDLPDQNRFLNYGYAIIRSIVARAVCGSGLHPSLGLHHHNKYDSFCLVSDMMEPFRPICDRAVALWVAEHGGKGELDGTVKKYLLTALTERVKLKGELRTLFEVAGRMSASLAQVCLGNKRKLNLPEL